MENSESHSDAFQGGSKNLKLAVDLVCAVNRTRGKMTFVSWARIKQYINLQLGKIIARVLPV